MATPIDNTQQTQQPAADPGANPDPNAGAADAGAPDEGAGDQPPEQMQALYKEFVLNAHALIYSPQVFPSVVKKLKLGADQDPIGTLADLAVMIVDRVYHEQKIPLELVQQAGTEVIEELAMVSEKAHAHIFSDKEKQGALYRGVDQFRVMLKERGEIDPGKAQQDLQALKVADQSGDLAKMIPPGSVGGHMGMPDKNSPPPSNDNAPRPRGMMAGA